MRTVGPQRGNTAERAAGRPADGAHLAHEALYDGRDPRAVETKLREQIERGAGLPDRAA